MDLQQAIMNNDVELTERILLDMLKQSPQKVDLWIKLCLTEFYPPFWDYMSALKYINEIYKVDSRNVKAIILECTIRQLNMGFINEELFQKLDDIICNDDKIMSIVYFIKSWYYDFMKERQKVKECLLKSIDLYDKYPYPLRDLGKIMEEEGKKDEGLALYRKAFSNITKIYQDDENDDFTDLNEYILEHVTGQHLSSPNYGWIKELAEKNL